MVNGQFPTAHILIGYEQRLGQINSLVDNYTVDIGLIGIDYMFIITENILTNMKNYFIRVFTSKRKKYPIFLHSSICI